MHGCPDNVHGKIPYIRRTQCEIDAKPYNGPLYDYRKDRRMAFLVASPHGPMYAGCKSGFRSLDAVPGLAGHRYAGIDRPMMAIQDMVMKPISPPEACKTP